MISIHLLLIAEQKSRRGLTLAEMKEELCGNTRYRLASRPLPLSIRDDEPKWAPSQKVKTIPLVPDVINVDGVNLNFDAIVVLQSDFPEGLYLGRQELRCYNIGVQDPQGEARKYERTSLVLGFGTTFQEFIPLYGMIDTGSGVSIVPERSSKITSSHALSLLSYDIWLYASNGIAEDIGFQLGGHTLKTNFILIADHLGAEDFLLGHNFLRTYNVLVDIAAMRVTIRESKPPRQFKPVHEVSNQDPFFVVSTEEITLGPFERKLVRAQVISQHAKEFRFSNVLIRPCGVHTMCPFVSEDTLKFVRDNGTVSLSLIIKTATDNVVVKKKIVIGKAELSTFVFEPIFVQQRGEASALPFEQTNHIR